MIKKILIYVGCILAFLVISYAYVPQVLQGKVVNQSDISGWRGMARESQVWNSTHPDDPTAWSDSMFSGMPNTSFMPTSEGDWTQKIYDFLLLGRRPATYFFISMLGVFLLLLSLGVNPLLAVGGAVAVTFCSYNLQIIQVGHNTKMQAIAFMPWVLAAFIFTYRSASRKKRWLPLTILGSTLFGLALSFQVKANHPQISYYLALALVLFAIVELVWLLADKERRAGLSRFFAASALLLALGCVGIATNASKMMPIWEYTPYSMRGGSSDSKAEGDGSKGLKLDYATAWSYGWEELPNLFIPNYNGGSSSGAVNPKKSETYDLLRRAGQPNLKEVCKNLPLYWGPQPFTAGPMYMGAITLFLFILGLMCIKSREKWWLVAVSVLAVLLALGNHFMWFTKLFYDVMPLYNKFRTVSMSLVLLQVTLPVLGFMALDAVLKSSDKSAILRRKVLLSGALSLGLCLLFALLQSIGGSFSGSADAGQPDVLVDALAADRRSLLWSDTWRSVIFIVIAVVLLLWGLSVPKGAEKTFETQPAMRMARRETAMAFICIAMLLDVFFVGKRYLNSEHFVTPRDFSGQFDQRPVDKAILADPAPSYRVLDLTVNVFNDSHPSYWHKNIGGYSPAKLQRYQEFIDSNLSSEINSLYRSISKGETISEIEENLPYCPGLAALNLRYIIIGADIAPLRYRHALGNAWFEDGDGLVSMTSCAPNRKEYEYSSGEGGRLVFSEVHYPVGWTLALEDGTEIPIELYEGNGLVPGDILRCADVPAGDHTLVMSFAPNSYRAGKSISLASSILLILLVLGSVAIQFVGRREED